MLRLFRVIFNAVSEEYGVENTCSEMILCGLQDAINSKCAHNDWECIINSGVCFYCPINLSSFDKLSAPVI